MMSKAKNNKKTTVRRIASFLVGVLVWLFVSEQCCCSSFTTPVRILRQESSTTRHGSTMEKQNPTAIQIQEVSSSYVSIEPQSASSETTTKLWRQLCPPIWSPEDTKDATLIWSCCDDTKQVAAELLRRLIDPKSSRTTTMTCDPRMEDNVAQSLEQFRDFCTNHLKSTTSGGSSSHDDDDDDGQQHHAGGYTFKARIVATRGPTGTKCPQWHVDHVPVRWIQSLVGPGCEMVVGNNTKESIRWNLVNGLNKNNNDDEDFILEESVEDRNQALVRNEVAQIYAAREQEAVLLIGNRWVDYAKDASRVSNIRPVVHKSPTLPWGCERVLLTQDIILDD